MNPNFFTSRKKKSPLNLGWKFSSHKNMKPVFTFSCLDHLFKAIVRISHVFSNRRNFIIIRLHLIILKQEVKAGWPLEGQWVGQVIVKAGSHPWTLPSDMLYLLTHTMRLVAPNWEMLEYLPWYLMATGFSTWVPGLDQQSLESSFTERGLQGRELLSYAPCHLLWDPHSNQEWTSARH